MKTIIAVIVLATSCTAHAQSFGGVNPVLLSKIQQVQNDPSHKTLKDILPDRSAEGDAKNVMSNDILSLQVLRAQIITSFPQQQIQLPAVRN